MKDLRISGVAKAFGPQPVLRGVDLVVPAGSFTAILGSSGSGKTTLLRIVAGFERPDDGEIRIGEELVEDAARRFVPSERRRIGYVPQEGALVPAPERGPQCRLRPSPWSRIAAAGSTSSSSSWGCPGTAGATRISSPADSNSGSPSPGRSPSVPRSSSWTSPSRRSTRRMRSSVRADVLAVLRQAGTTSMLVTHDQDEALSMADQVAVLRHGVIAQLDTPAALYGRPGDVELAQFLGESNVLEGEVHGGTAATALGRPLRGGRQRSSPQAGGPRSWSAQSRSGSTRPATVGWWRRCRATSTTGTMPWCGSGPKVDGLPDLVVRVTGGVPLEPGHRVGLSVLGAVRGLAPRAVEIRNSSRITPS